MKTNTWKKSERVAVYVDGFNLHYAMLDAGLKNYTCLDIREMVNKILKPDQKLMDITYFTSRLMHNKSAGQDQKAYFRFLKQSGVKIVFGNYKYCSEKCLDCGHEKQISKEKMTDVNIATSLLIDAFYNTYDTAILISGDSDLAPPIGEIHKIFKDKKVLMAFPPKRYNTQLAKIAKGAFCIQPQNIMNSLFEAGKKKLLIETLKETKNKCISSAASSLKPLDLEKLFQQFSLQIQKT